MHNARWNVACRIQRNLIFFFQIFLLIWNKSEFRFVFQINLKPHRDNPIPYNLTWIRNPCLVCGKVLNFAAMLPAMMEYLSSQAADWGSCHRGGPDGTPICWWLMNREFSAKYFDSQIVRGRSPSDGARRNPLRRRYAR